MKVLLVSISAPPQQSPESLQVMKYAGAIAQQAEVTLLTIEEEKRGWRRADPALTHALNGMRVVRLPHFSKLSRGLIRLLGKRMLKPDEDFLFPLQWKKAIRKLDHRPDIIYSRSTPYSSALMALRLQEYYRVPWVMHLSDPWVLSPHYTYTGSLARYHQEKECLCFERADAITLTSAEQVESYARLYPRFAHKLMYFPNVFNDEEMMDNPLEFGSKMIFLYSGNFYGEGRNPQYLFEAIQQVTNQDPDFFNDCEFVFIGQCTQEIQRILSTFAKPYIKLIETYTFDELVEMQRKAHVFLLFDWRFKNVRSEFFLSKILAYMVMQRPILAIAGKDSTCYKVINGKYGVCFEHHDAAGIAGWLKQAVMQYRKRNEQFFKVAAPDPAFSANYNARRLLNLFAELKSRVHV
ncbi:MAG: hypothetical protein KatS3mg032_1013 [Cyclobacteriaceae bacterium]|nr:MAG: hypothetical protein KatS3mg032_1013 [Cyclobacteriaceae bacterium]